jgi:hypothetical protein
MYGYVDVHLASPWTVGFYLYSVFKSLFHHRPVPGESEYSSSKNRGPSDGLQNKMAIFLKTALKFLLQWNLYLSFPDNSFSRICCSISMVPERILFQLWLPHLLFSRIHCFFFRPPTKTMNRGFTVFSNLWRCEILVFSKLASLIRHISLLFSIQ